MSVDRPGGSSSIVRRARVRLTLQYIGLVAIALLVFSVVFYAAFALVLQPAFDIAPELSNGQAAEVAYRLTIERIGIALVAADLVAIVLVGVAAWVVAKRTLEPIRDAHLRQQRFVADASHETRNPLAAIKTTAETALAGDRPAGELRTALKTIEQATDRLVRLTGDLLVLARSNDPTAPARRDTVDLSVLAAEAVDGLVQASPGASIRPQFEAGLTIHVDPDEVGRIARNLIENSHRHGGAGATISVRTWADDGNAVLEVADDGPGIAAADLERIFEPFYRVGGAARDSGGVGLGLAIARDLTARNGGRLTAASAPGAGSRFRLVFPRLR